MSEDKEFQVKSLHLVHYDEYASTIGLRPFVFLIFPFMSIFLSPVLSRSCLVTTIICGAGPLVTLTCDGVLPAPLTDRSTVLMHLTLAIRRLLHISIAKVV